MEISLFEQGKKIKDRIVFFQLLKQSFIGFNKNEFFRVKVSLEILGNSTAINTGNITPPAGLGVLNSYDKSDFDYLIVCIDKKIEELEVEFNKL
jgi:hypothetical protein